MSTLDRAKTSIQRITSNSNGFARSMVFTAPDTSTVTVKGLHTKHYLGIDEEGAAVNSKTAYVSVSEQLFIDAGFSIRDAEGEVNLDAYKVAVADSTGSTFNYRIAQYFPDETIGLIVCFLQDYAD